VGDGVMLLLAVFAGLWSKPPQGLRNAFVIAVAVAVFAVVLLRRDGGAADRDAGAGQRDGRRQALLARTRQDLPVLLRPGVACIALTRPKRMSQYQWGDTRLIGIPISQPQWAASIHERHGVHMDISTDLEKLKQVFPYTAVPAGVALESGREKGALVKFEAEEPEGLAPAARLRQVKRHHDFSPGGSSVAGQCPADRPPYNYNCCGASPSFTLTF